MDIIEISKYGTNESTILKVIEEIHELGEVLVKFITKKEGSKPSKEKIAEESGDLFVRLGVLMHKLEIEEQVVTRIEQKTIEISEFLKNNK